MCREAGGGVETALHLGSPETGIPAPAWPPCGHMIWDSGEVFLYKMGGGLKDGDHDDIGNRYWQLQLLVNSKGQALRQGFYINNLIHALSVPCLTLCLRVCILTFCTFYS